MTHTSLEKKKTLVVHVHQGRKIAGLFAGSKLMDIFIEQAEDTGFIGSIYLGQVTRVMPSMQACFVDIGIGRDGFLSADDALYAQGQKNTRRDRIEHLVQRNQYLIVQVTKEPVADKGCRLTTDLSLPGRYMVLKPYDSTRGVSRSIEDEEERKRLAGLAEMYVPPEFGVIVRTAAAGISRREFRADYKYLIRLWQQIVRDRRMMPQAGLLHEDLDLVERVLRDHYTSGEFEQVIIDDKQERRRILRFLKSISPRGQWDKRVVAFDRADSLDHRFHLRQEIARAMQKRVPLECGGYLIIEEMETLTAIDVNTGKNIRGDQQGEIILQTNLEAAEEIPRQLRLRGIGGIVVIDFIDMDNKGDRRKVTNALRAALRTDKAASDVYSYPDIGLVHLTRQRTRMTLSRLLTAECPTCHGNGVVPCELLLHG